jgi:hypothetical protein
VYIVNLHPLAPKDIPQDKDLVDDRESDILFHNRTTYDEQVAYAFTDFVNMTRELVELARSNGLSKVLKSYLIKRQKPYLELMNTGLLHIGIFCLESRGYQRFGIWANGC